MAARGDMSDETLSSSEDEYDEKDDIMSETGIIFGMDDIEELILAEIRKTRKAKQRADTTSVCKALYKAKGLTESVITMQLQ